MEKEGRKVLARVPMPMPSGRCSVDALGAIRVGR